MSSSTERQHIVASTRSQIRPSAAGRVTHPPGVSATITPMSPPSFRVQPADEHYLAASRAEAAFWDKPQFFSAEACAGTPRSAPFNAYTNQRLTGDPAVRWFETLQRHGVFRDGLFFGCSAVAHEARILELNPELSCLFMDISPASLERRATELGSRFPGRVSVVPADLNFAALPEAAYDVIISGGTLHHLVNIEHAAYQINRALRPNGWFFLQDYVMEDRLQCSEARKAMFEAMVARGKRRGELPPSTEIHWPAPDAPELSPFEAIRAEDTLAVLEATLERVDVRGSGALTGLLLFLRLSEDDARRFDNPGQHLWHERPHSWRRRLLASLGRQRRPAMSKHFQDEIILLDALCIDSGLLTPFNAFGTFRKRPSP